MFTTVAFSDSKDPAGVFVNIPAVPDPHIKTAGNYIYVADYNHLVGENFVGLGDTTPGQCRLISPSIRRINPYYVTPVDDAIYNPADILPTFHPEAAVPLDIGEGLECEVNSTPTAAGQQTCTVFLAPGAITPVTGDIKNVRFTITVAGVIESWEFSEITLIDELPVGQYDIVGARVEADEGIAFRFVPVGASHRPGGMIVADALVKSPYEQRNGRMGVWCSFGSVQLPGIEVLFSAAEASATYQCFMDIIRRS